MASIYDKALKRKDFSGVVPTNDKEDSSSPDAKVQPKKENAADIGKIVQLCSGDANKVSLVFSFMFMFFVRACSTRP